MEKYGFPPDSIIPEIRRLRRGISGKLDSSTIPNQWDLRWARKTGLVNEIENGWQWLLMSNSSFYKRAQTSIYTDTNEQTHVQTHSCETIATMHMVYYHSTYFYWLLADYLTRNIDEICMYHIQTIYSIGFCNEHRTFIFSICHIISAHSSNSFCVRKAYLHFFSSITK